MLVQKTQTNSNQSNYLLIKDYQLLRENEMELDMESDMKNRHQPGNFKEPFP